MVAPPEARFRESWGHWEVPPGVSCVSVPMDTMESRIPPAEGILKGDQGPKGTFLVKPGVWHSPSEAKTRQLEEATLVCMRHVDSAKRNATKETCLYEHTLLLACLSDCSRCPLSFSSFVLNPQKSGYEVGRCLARFVPKGQLCFPQNSNQLKQSIETGSKLKGSEARICLDFCPR